MRQNFVRILCIVLVAIVFGYGLSYANNLTGKITVNVKQGNNWVTQPLEGVTVIIGKNIWLESTQAGDFVRNAKNIVARTQTNAKGEFQVNLPKGEYTIILWKREYVPVSGPVSVPGTYTNNLSHKKISGGYSHTSLGFKDN